MYKTKNSEHRKVLLLFLFALDLYFRERKRERERVSTDGLNVLTTLFHQTLDG